jgi:hypothetical protein
MCRLQMVAQKGHREILDRMTSSDRMLLSLLQDEYSPKENADAD